jgi:hypothetical protein
VVWQWTADETGKAERSRPDGSSGRQERSRPTRRGKPRQRRIVAVKVYGKGKPRVKSLGGFLAFLVWSTEDACDLSNRTLASCINPLSSPSTAPAAMMVLAAEVRGGIPECNSRERDISS